MNPISPKRLKIVSGVIFVVVVILLGYFFLPEMLRQPANSTNDLEQSGVPAVKETAPIKVEAAPARMGDLVMALATTGVKSVVSDNHRVAQNW